MAEEKEKGDTKKAKINMIGLSEVHRLTKLPKK